ncbi:MAG TPA: tyrosine-type recombinase/integrase [Abditibacteriaceae bacterium]|jgi:site-specific recombinase XerD
MKEPALLHFPKLGLPLGELVGRYLRELQTAGRSKHTISNYRSDLERFVRAVGPQMPAANLSRTAVTNHLASLDGLALSTRARHQAAIRSFCRWCHAQGHCDRNPAEHLATVRVPESMPRAIEDGAIQQILDAIPPENLRDRLLFTLVAETGVRISEALGIYREDISLSPDDEKIAVRGKGNTARTVMLYSAPQTLKLLKRFLAVTKIASGPLFRGHWRQRGSSQPLTYRAAHINWNRYCHAAGVPTGIHTLRHSYATTLVNSGVRLEVVRKLLGHKSMQTTLRYAELNDASVKAELREHQREKRFR